MAVKHAGGAVNAGTRPSLPQVRVSLQRNSMSGIVGPLATSPETFGMDAVLEPLLFVHRLLGYATVLVIGPAVLLTWRRHDVHARWGRFYVYAMVLLYLSGTPRTFYFQPWPSWSLARNFTFNFFGILQVLVGFRAIFRWKGSPQGRVDNWLTWVFCVNAAGMIVAAPPDLPIFLVGLFALAVAACDEVELRRNPLDGRVHMRRHLRHMFGSYYYLLTVLSIVHLPVGHDLKWLWCGAFGVAMWLLSRGGQWNPMSKLRGMPGYVRGTLAANGGLALFVLGQSVYERSVAEVPIASTWEQKESLQREVFESAQRKLIEKYRDGRVVSRGEWEKLLQLPEGARLTKEEQDRLRRDQRRRIDSRTVEARLRSSFDLDRIRRTDRLREFCRLLPKGGMLHVHPTGTLHPSTVTTLLEQVNPVVALSQFPSRAAFDDEEVAFLQRYSDSIRFRDLAVDDRRRLVQLFTMPAGNDDFARFEAIFGLVGRFNTDAQVDGFTQICDAFLARAADHRVRYVEFTTSIDPQVESLLRWERVTERALSRFGITLRVNAAFHRGASESENLKKYLSLAALLRERRSVVVGIDLLGPERNYPAFEAGRQIYSARLADSSVATPHATFHVGGIGDVRNVRDAILLGAERIGHGTRWPDDPMVLEYAARIRLPVEVNPHSNVRLGYARDLRSHPFLDLLRLGLRVSLSTDDEGIFETDISHEYAYVISETDVTYAEIKQLVYHSLETAFVAEEERRGLLAQLDADFRRFEEYDLPRLTEPALTKVAEQGEALVR